MARRLAGKIGSLHPETSLAAIAAIAGGSLIYLVDGWLAGLIAAVITAALFTLIRTGIFDGHR